jgi:hypothetical protein
LQLTGDGAYVDLPDALISRQVSATLEFWMTWQGEAGRRFERIFDFGRSTWDGGSEPSVESNFFLSPNYDDGGTPRLHFRAQSGEQSRLFASARIPSGKPTHVVVVMDGPRRTMSLYVDGQSFGSSSWRQRFDELRDDNVWLGRSQHANDPGLAGTFDEFRVYGVALTPEQIQRSGTRGPDRLP